MKRIVGIALLGVAVLFAADPGFAAITGTPHEIPALAKQGACSACHIPHKATGKRLWPSNMDTVTGLDSRGEVGALCGFCHDPVEGIVESAKTPYPFKDISGATHGLDKTAAPDGQATLDGTLPYISSSAGTMQCTSCHNVHDNAFQPFLQADIDSLCAKCHPARQFVGGTASTVAGAWGNFYGSTDSAGHAGNPGSHPVGTDIWTDTSNHDFTGTTTADLDSPINVSAINIFPYLATRWQLGPHAINGTTATALSGTAGMGCVTCHMVHGRDNTAHTDYLDPVEDLLVVYQGETGGEGGGGHANGNLQPNNALCELCHRGTAVNVDASYAAGTDIYADPGTTTFTHPVDDYYTGAEANVAGVPQTPPWPLGSLQVLDPPIICESCHMPHPLAAVTYTADNSNSQPFGTGTNSHILRDADINICDRCHTSAPVDHHPVGVGLMDGVLFDDAAIGNDDTNMNCSDCHNGSGAHNWSGVGNVGLDPDWEPRDNGRAADTQLTPYQTNTSKECIDCHNANSRMSPTKAVGSAAHGEYQYDGTASHYLGTFDAATWAHYGGNLAGPFTTNAWTASDNIPGWSRFGGTGDTSAVLVCESCHELEPDKNSPGLSSLLLEPYVEGSTTESRNMFCEGCHGANATATGAPHPMTGTDISKASNIGRTFLQLKTTGGAWSTSNTAGTFADITGAPLQNTTYPADDQMNCDSCHQPHNADSNSGSYILESSTGGTEVTGTPDQATTLYGKTWNFGFTDTPTVPLDYRLFCNLCHASGS